MNNHCRPNPALRPGKSHMMQILVGAAVVVIAIGIVATMAKSGKSKNDRAEALRKLQDIGAALTGYLNDNNGEFPLEDATGKDN